MNHICNTHPPQLTTRERQLMMDTYPSTYVDFARELAGSGAVIPKDPARPGWRAVGLAGSWCGSANMATAVLTPTRALRQARRLDLRAVFGLFLLLVATGGSIAFWSASSDTRAVLVATRDLPAGATLKLMDLAIAR